MLTADTGAGTGRLQAEYIVDGRKVKVGKNMAQAVGKEIAEDLVSSSYYESYVLVGF